MGIWHRILACLPGPRRRAREADLERELRSHLEFEAAEQQGSGLSSEDASYAARRALGNTRRIRDDVRSVWFAEWPGALRQDLRFGLRMLRKSPGFAIVAVLTLALGIGANTAIFGVVNGFLLRPLPVKDPGQITVLARQQKNGTLSQGLSYPEYQELRRQGASVFSNMLAYRLSLDGLSVNGHADHILDSFVTGNYFTVLGVKPFLGRLILPSEGQTAGADAVIVLGYDYWKARFGSSQDVVGKSVSVDGHPFTIIGVAPPSFHGLNSIMDMQAYFPMGMSMIDGFSNDFMSDRQTHGFIVFARLKPSASLKQARAAVKVIAGRLAEEHPADEKDLALTVVPEMLARPAVMPRNPIVAVSALFMGLAALVLLLACFNVANLLLVRATVRQREMAIRAALGATRTRLIRQLLTESLLLASLGGSAGILIGIWGSATIASINFHMLAPVLLNFRFDWRVFAFALIAAALTGIIVGLVPALRASRSDLNDVLHEGGRAVAGTRQKLRSGLVIAEIAGSLVLLIVAALFTRSLQDAQHMDLGFDPHGVLNLTMDPRQVGYSDLQDQEFYKQLLERVHALPGVRSASLAYSVPMGDVHASTAIDVPGYTPPPGQPAPTVAFNIVSPEYFQTMRTSLVRGRTFTGADDEKAARVAIVNEAMAERFWPHEEPIGRTFWDPGEPKQIYRVVGIVKNVATFTLFRRDEPYLYLPLAQNYASFETLQVRTAGDPESMAAELQKQIAAIAPALPVFDVQTMSEALGSVQGFLMFRLGAALAATLGLLGLALVLVGVYGVVSFAASQRTHEIGIRMALGAQPREIRKMVFRQGIFLVISGLVAGLLGALAASHVVGNFLIGVSAVDPAILGIVSALLAVATLAACYVPARRATRVDPVTALRSE